MMNTLILSVLAAHPRLVAASTQVHVLAEAYCLPDKAQNALDTAVLWTKIVAAVMGTVSLMLIGIGWFFQGNRHDGGAMFKSLGVWIGGAVLIGAAAGIAALFLGSITGSCTPAP